MSLDYKKTLYAELIVSLSLFTVLGYIGFISINKITQSVLVQSERSIEISHLQDLKFLNTAISLEVHKAAQTEAYDSEEKANIKELIEDYYSIIDEKKAFIFSDQFKKKNPDIYQEANKVLNNLEKIKLMIFKKFFPFLETNEDISSYLYVIKSSLQANVDNLDIIVETAETNVNQSLEKMANTSRSFLTLAIVLFIMIIVVFILFLIFTNKRMEKPLAQLIHAIQHIGDGNTNIEELEKRTDAVGILSKIVKEIDIEIFTKTKIIGEKEKILLHQAHYDSLTDLPNRFLMHDRLRQAIKKAKRNQTHIALMFIDLDRFKEINDSLGHHVGDQVLQETSQRFTSCIRAQDTLARLGGDEFTIIVDDLHNPKDIKSLARKVVQVLHDPILIDEHEFYISSSIGISIYPEHGEDIETLLRNADLAMYKAKNNGRNNFQFYQEIMSKDSLQKLSMESELHKALLSDQFVVYYQPQMNTSRKELVGMEALVRWKHPEKGLIPPFEFLPLAEEMGIINKIDEIVFKKVCQQIVQWQSQGLPVVKVAVNLSGRQLQRDDLVESLLFILEMTQCDPLLLELEVTEGFIMYDHKKSINILHDLRELGFTLAIDDFGTGYSSLSYLKQLPITKLKIDKSFVDHINTNAQDGAITNTIITLSRAMNLNVIAEGVETQEQSDLLKELGCDEIQGYLYSPPVPANEALTFLENTSI